MKKYLIILFLLIFPFKVLAVAPIYNIINGVSDYPNSIQSTQVLSRSTINQNCDYDNDLVLISSSTPYTLLSYSIHSYLGKSTTYSLACNGGSDIPDETTVPEYNITQMQGDFHCSSDLVLTASACPGTLELANLRMQYVAYDTRGSTSTNMNIDTISINGQDIFIPFLDFLFFLIVLSFTIFLLWFLYNLIYKKE